MARYYVVLALSMLACMALSACATPPPDRTDWGTVSQWMRDHPNG